VRPKKQAEMRGGPEEAPGMSYETRNQASFDPDRATEMRLEAARKAMGKAGYMDIENAPAKGADDGKRPDPFAGARPKSADEPGPPRGGYHSSPKENSSSFRFQPAHLSELGDRGFTTLDERREAAFQAARETEQMLMERELERRPRTQKREQMIKRYLRDRYGDE